MRLLGLGLNHKTAPVALRERFALSKEKVRRGLQHLGEYDPLHEAVVVSTCNRSEIYAMAADEASGVEAIHRFWADMTGQRENIDEYLYTFMDEGCVRHLFRVASSLDSLVIGEGQILSQVKDAYAMAHAVGTRLPVSV